MSDSQGKPPEKAPNSGRDPRRDKNQSSNGMWYVLVFSVIGILIFSTMSQSRDGEKVTLTEFKRSVENKVRTARDIHELTIGPTQMTWQDCSIADVRKGKTAKRYYVGVWGIGDQSINDLLKLLEDNGIEATGGQTPSAFAEMLPMLFLTVLMVGLFIFLLRRLGGTGSAMSFGRSRGRLYAQDDVGVTFDDVAGIDEAVEELKEVVEFLKTPQKYQSLG